MCVHSPSLKNPWVDNRLLKDPAEGSGCEVTCQVAAQSLTDHNGET